MPYADPEAARAAAAERQRRWRERRRQGGLSTHPERQRRRDAGLPARPERHAKPWCFIDTEGANDPEGRYGDPGRQWTFLICAASDDGFERHLYRGRPLTTAELIDFIVWLPRRFKLGGYFFQYDLDQIYWQLGAERLEALYGSGRPAEPVIYQRWLLARFHTQARFILPRELPELPVENLNAAAAGGRSATVWDVGKFYQAKLTTAISNWGVAEPEEEAFIERMKAARLDFSLGYWERHHEELLAYSLLENRLAARLQTKFDRTCSELGYPLTSWYGAGSMAKAMMLAHGVNGHLEARAPIRRRARRPEDLAARLPYAYFGGRFEIQRPGEFSPVHEYDLRSAYPASYRALPCLVHGRWSLQASPPAEIPEIGPHDLLVADWRIPASHLWGPFPRRDRDGSISYPAGGSDHPVWGEELLAALKLWPLRHGPVKGQGIYPRRWWRYRASCSCEPFGWIDRVYEQRVALGKDAAGYPLKLGMNAIYGSLASVLGASFDPKSGRLAGWAEPRWASMITAWTRARLLEALGAAGGPRSDSVIMFATDALYTTRPIELDLTDRLGGWEHKSFPRGGLLIQPGLYHLRGQDVVSKLKGRGIAFADMQAHIRRFHSAWRRDGEAATVRLPLSPRYMGLRLMLHRGDLEGAWRWQQMERQISFDPSIKRELRGGRRMPRSPGSYRGHEPHPGFLELIEGVAAELPAISPEQLRAQMEEESQPDGPMAH